MEKVIGYQGNILHPSHQPETHQDLGINVLAIAWM